MKWLKRILVTLLAIVGISAMALFLAGLRDGAHTMTVHVEVNKPRAAVWAHFHDPEKLKGWVNWLAEVKSLTPGNEGVGAREVWIMIDRNNNNERMEISNEITAIEPGRRVAFRLWVPKEFDGTATYEFEEAGANRTIVTGKSSYRFVNGFVQFMAPVVLRFAEKKMAADMEQFKVNVEKE